jgi:hypothetical protein
MDEELLDLLARVVGVLDADLVADDPELVGMISQVIQILQPKAHPLPLDITEQLVLIDNRIERFKRAAELLQAYDPEKLKQLSESMRASGLLKNERSIADRIQENVDESISEVKAKTEAQIETETAIKWAARAVACYRHAKESTDQKEQIKWILRGEDFRHEAIEHASLVGDQGGVLSEVETAVKDYLLDWKGLLDGLRKSESSTPLERAEKADLVTLPEDVKGTNCANCRYVDPERDYCNHKDVAQSLKSGSKRMCCALWDSKGTKRAWLKD